MLIYFRPEMYCCQYLNTPYTLENLAVTGGLSHLYITYSNFSRKIINDIKILSRFMLSVGSVKSLYFDIKFKQKTCTVIFY